MKPGRVVVDTSVVSYLLKSHSLAPWYSDLLRGRLVGLSFMSLAEFYRWPLERERRRQERRDTIFAAISRAKALALLSLAISAISKWEAKGRNSRNWLALAFGLRQKMKRF